MSSRDGPATIMDPAGAEASEPASAFCTFGQASRAAAIAATADPDRKSIKATTIVDANTWTLHRRESPRRRIIAQASFGRERHGGAGPTASPGASGIAGRCGTGRRGVSAHAGRGAGSNPSPDRAGGARPAVMANDFIFAAGTGPNEMDSLNAEPPQGSHRARRALVKPTGPGDRADVLHQGAVSATE
jgi:hypothetical protein